MSLSDKSDPWSASKPTLLRELRRSQSEGEPAVLATVVDVDGSAYRRPGAKMLVSGDGESLGAVTAGCLEGPIVELAATVLEQGRPRLETFDLTDDDEWGLGLGCNGVIDLLLEPVDGSFGPALSSLNDRESVAVLTVTETSDPDVTVGDRTVLPTSGRTETSDTRDPLPDTVLGEVKSVAAELRSTGTSASLDVSTANGDVRVFIDCIDPAPRLLLFGNQNDIQPVSRIGRDVGFEVVVASARGAKADKDDYPYSHDVVVTHPGDVANLTDDLTYAVLMSHNFLDDQLALESLQKSSDVPYIGLMGPRKRFERMREALAEDGVTLTEEQLERISTPVGLDLGGGEPNQIALSIVSEVLAIDNGRSGGRLKDKEGPIHERVSVSVGDS